MKHIHRPTTTLLVALFVLLATPKSTAQTVVPPQRAQGHFSTWATAFTSPNTTGTNDPVLIRAPGIANGYPTAWSSALFGTATVSHPDLSTPALMHWVPSALMPVQLGGISSGNDLMPFVDANGELDMPYGNTSHWLTVTATVDQAATGVDSSTMIALRAAAHSTFDGDIMSYYAIGSELIHPVLYDANYLEMSSEQLNLHQIQNGTSRITNSDIGFGVMSADQYGSEGRVTIPCRNKFYFSLTHAWVMLARAANLQIDGDLPNASTVYVMTWEGSPLAWSDPVVAFSHDELFPEIPLPGPDEYEGFLLEIDAVAVDKGEGDFPRALVFSLTPDSDQYSPDGSEVGFDQILVYQNNTATGATTTARHALMTDGTSAVPSTEVSTRMGAKRRTATGAPDNFTSLCLVDPKDGDATNATLGRATAKFEQGQGELGLSAFRTCPPTGNTDTVTFQVTGMSYSQYQAGAIQWFIEGPEYDPLTQLPPGNFAVGSPILIDAGATTRNTMDLPVPFSHVPGVPSQLRVSAKLLGYNGTNWVPVRQSWVITIGI